MAGGVGQAVSGGVPGVSTATRSAWLPGRCLLCGDPSDRAALCPHCLCDLPFLGPGCRICALPGPAGDAPCGACQLRRPPWRSATAALRYGFPSDTLVRTLKYRRRLAAGAALSQAMAWAGPPPPALASPVTPWLVPVPLHWTRELVRGFNQAVELSLQLSRATGWPVLPRALRRVRRTRAQAGLGRWRRRRNLAGAFRWRGPDLAGQAVVLVDDVLTTGATAEACCRALKGAASVDLWVAARALD